MTAPSYAVKKTARTVLKGRYFKCGVCCTVYVFAILIFSVIAGVLSVAFNNTIVSLIYAAYAFFILGPLLLGLVRFFRRLLWDASDAVSEILYYFSSLKLYRKAVSLEFFVGIRILVAGIILFIPAGVAYAFSSQKIYHIIDTPIPVWSAGIGVLASFLEALGGVMLFFVSLRYYLTPFLLAANENIEVAEIIHMSATISRRTLFDFFFLCLSVLHIVLLSVFVAPLVFTLPYLMTVYCVHCRFAVARYNIEAEHINNSDTPSFTADV